MLAEDLEALLPALEAFHARFARFFRRSEGRALGRRYLIGLASPIERKNAENVAERVGASPRKLQEFLSDSPWDDEGCIGELQRFVGEQLGAPGGVLVLDDTGFPKKGVHSAGVGRQYSGTLGRVDNCQVGVFLGYASAHGHTLVDRRLYLHAGWLADPAKRGSPRAGVPPEVGFRTKLELAAEMLTQALERGQLPFAWVTADAAYGDSHDLRSLVAGQGRWYCFEVSRDALVWTADPAWRTPARSGRVGRPRTKARPTPKTPPARAVESIVAELPAEAWVRHRVTEGAKGPREYEFARLRVVEKVHHEPGSEGWLMARRPVGADPGADIKCYLSNAPETVALAEMAAVGCLRWTIEEDFELAKGEVGLDHYELTRYRGWYHHITLSLMALAFLKAVQREWGGKKEPPHQCPRCASCLRSCCRDSAGMPQRRSPGSSTSAAARPRLGRATPDAGCGSTRMANNRRCNTRTDLPAWRDQVRRIADTGFSTLLMPDVPRWQPAPEPTLAVAATLTDLRVGTWVYASPLRPPWSMAWEAHSLSVLTEGRFEMGIGTGRPGIEDELRELGLPVVTPGERLSQVRETVTSLRQLDGPDLHTPVAMAVRGPKAQALAAELADTVTFLTMPGDSRAEIMRLAADFRAIRDVELALHVPVVGDAVAPFMTSPDTDPAALRAADSLAILPSDPTAAIDEILRRREGLRILLFRRRRQRRSCARSCRRRADRTLTRRSIRLRQTRSTRPQFDAQREQIARAVERHGLVDTGIEWTVAHSGWRIAAHPAWSEMLTRAGDAFDVLVVGYASRFARSLEAHVDARRAFYAAGAAILFADERILSSDDDAWDAWAREVVEAESYSRRLSRRVREGYEMKRRRLGTPGENRPPFGYRREGRPPVMIVDEERMAVVRRAYELSASGMRDREVAVRVGLKLMHVREVLTNPVYRGRLHRGEPSNTGVVAQHPPRWCGRMAAGRVGAAGPADAAGCRQPTAVLCLI